MFQSSAGPVLCECFLTADAGIALLLTSHFSSYNSTICPRKRSSYMWVPYDISRFTFDAYIHRDINGKHIKTMNSVFRRSQSFTVTYTYQFQFLSLSQPQSAPRDPFLSGKFLSVCVREREWGGSCHKMPSLTEELRGSIVENWRRILIRSIPCH